MSGLSEVSTLFGQRAGDIEKAREIFVAESRQFVEGILGAIRRSRSEPWINVRVRIDLPRELESEGKAGYLTNHWALARTDLRFKREARFMPIAETRFGIEFDEPSDAFVWQIALVPVARYPRVDDVVWRAWRENASAISMPGSARHERANAVRFVSRPIDVNLSAQVAFDDVNRVLEFLLTTGNSLGEAVGLEPEIPDEDGAAVRT